MDTFFGNTTLPTSVLAELMARAGMDNKQQAGAFEVWRMRGERGERVPALELLGALKRLESAAFNRSSTWGDQCRLIVVQSELRAAADHARAVIAGTEGRALPEGGTAWDFYGDTTLPTSVLAELMTQNGMDDTQQAGAFEVWRMRKEQTERLALELLDALKRLESAAVNREAWGNANELVAARAELDAAARHARAVIAKAEGRALPG